MIYSDENKRIDIITSALHRINECSFYNLHNNNELGGAVSVNNDNCQFYCCNSFFVSCSAKSSGGIHISKSDNVVCSHVCAFNCSSEESYAYFSLLKSSTNLICNFFSTHFCTGYAATTDFSSKQVTVSNINTTNNNGDQEPSFLISHFDFASLKFADSLSNYAQRIGLNIYSGKIAIADHIHYDNCTIVYYDNDYIASHIKFHNVTEESQLLNSYVSVDINSHAYAILSQGSIVSLQNIFLMGSNSITGTFKSTINVQFIINQIKTQHYSFLNTKLCQAKVFVCNSLIKSNRSLSYFILFIAIIIL